MMHNITDSNTQTLNTDTIITNKYLGFFSSRKFVLLFSLVTALFWTLSFYPGILYSDSIPRWLLAIEIAKNGFTHLSYSGSHHPVIPSILQAPFYLITKEIGFYIFCQATAFCMAFFFFVRSFSKTALAQILTAAVLLIPINHIYAIFHSFDSIFAIAFISLIAGLIRLKESKNKKRYIALCITLFFICTSSRLNSILLLFPILLYCLYIYRPLIKNKKAVTLMMFLWLFATIFPVFTPSLLQMKGGNSWAIGFAWEYANLATKSENSKHIEYLEKLGASPSEIRSNICYNGIWCGSEHREVISKVQGNSLKSKDVFLNYFDIAINEPTLFINEKMKYISSLMGISRPLENFEIAKWRSGNWGDRMRELGFYTSPHKEKIIDNYFEFSKRNEYLFKPFIILGLLLLTLPITIYFRHAQTPLNLFLASLLGILYYFTFIITAQNHELRYFFPSLFLFQGIAIVFITKILDILPRKNVILIIISILVIAYVSKTLKAQSYYDEKMDNLNKENSIFVNDSIQAVYTAENNLLLINQRCDINKRIRFFLHVTLFDEQKKNNHNKNLDFYWKEKEIKKPIFRSRCMAEIPLPKEVLVSFRIGQFNSKYHRLWESYISKDQVTISMPKKIRAFDLTDGNWVRGISKHKVGFFVRNTPQNRLLKNGVELILPHSGRRTIKQIYINGDYINIYLSGSKLTKKDGAPSWIKIE